MILSKDDIVLVTGASGFVGSAVARALLASGLRVRIILRETSPAINVSGLGAQIVAGDLRDPVAVAQAMQGVAALFHVAADYRLWARDPEDIMRNNVGMTRIVMQAAAKAGVQRIVYTSSVATFAPFADGRSSDETRPLTEANAIGAYKRSKVAAERLVQAMVRDHRLPAIIVNPSTPIGPRDVRPTPTGRIVLEAAAGRMPAFVDTGLNLVHVDDVASGHLAALAQGKIGEHYILGGQNVDLRTMLCEIARLVNRPPPRLRLPRKLVFPVAWACEKMASLTGREPLATLDGLRMAKYHMYFSSAKAERDLNYRARPYGQALADAIAWFRQTGRLA